MFAYIIYKLGQFLALHLPLRAAYMFAALVSDIRLIFAERDRREVSANLKIIFPGKTDAEIQGLIKNLYRNFAKYLVDFFCFTRINKKYIENNIRLENMEYLSQAQALGKGVICVTAHIGNWELGGAVTGMLGYPLVAVALPHKHKAVDNFFNYQRKQKGITVVPLNRAVRQCLAALSDKRLIALVGDRDINFQGIIVDFFGKPTSFPEGPAAFAVKTGAPIVCGFMIRDSNDNFTLRFEKPIIYQPKGLDKQQEIIELIKEYKLIIEDYIKRFPDQWYMFRRFWAE